MRLDNALPTAFDRLSRIKGTTQIQTIVEDRTSQCELCLCNYIFVELRAFCWVFLYWSAQLGRNGSLCKMEKLIWKLRMAFESLYWRQIQIVFHFEWLGEREKLFSIGKRNLSRTWVRHIIKDRNEPKKRMPVCLKWMYCEANTGEREQEEFPTKMRRESLGAGGGS